MSDDKEKKEPISPEEEKGEENREEIPVEGLDISHKGPADSGDITDSIPDELPVIFIRDLTVFPYMALPSTSAVRSRRSPSIRPFTGTGWSSFSRRRTPRWKSLWRRTSTGWARWS